MWHCGCPPHWEALSDNESNKSGSDTHSVTANTMAGSLRAALFVGRSCRYHVPQAFIQFFSFKQTLPYFSGVKRRRRLSPRLPSSSSFFQDGRHVSNWWVVNDLKSGWRGGRGTRYVIPAGCRNYN